MTQDSTRIGFTAYMHDLINREQSNNQFMDQEFAQFDSEVHRYFLERGIT